MAPGENTPDFDKMTPEEIMAWMESLAKRQGANPEELTTSANVDIPEIDPDSVVVDEPGYVPYGEERPPKPVAPPVPRTPVEPPRPLVTPQRPPITNEPRFGGPPAPQSPQRPPFQRPGQPGSAFPRGPQAPQSGSQFGRAPQNTPPTGQTNPFSRSPQMPQRTPPVTPPPPRVDPAPEQPRTRIEPPRNPAPWERRDPLPPLEDLETKPTQTKSTALDSSAMEWLESLAADQSDTLFSLDLSALSQELEPKTAVKAAQPTVDPLEWLEQLAEPEETRRSTASWVAPSEPEPPPAPPVSDPFSSGVDPMAWLENLARRQGASSEELTTSTEMNIPVPENPVIDEPGYKPFTVDTPSIGRDEPEDSFDDPAKWLESLADSQGFAGQAIADEPADDLSDIESAISRGTVTPEQMQVYLEQQTDLYVESLGEEPEVEDEPPVRAELPDWLLEQVGPPPVMSPGTEETSLPPLSEILQEPPPATDIPDWLKEEDKDALDFENIFADTDDVTVYEPLTEPAFAIEPDPNDPWVEAFDLEQAEGADESDAIPEWYARNLNDPDRIAAVNRMTQETIEIEAAERQPDLLAAAELPIESELPAGEREAVPAWMFPAEPETPSIDAEPEPVVEAVIEVPDWLRDAPAAVQPQDIPEWLKESLEEEPAAEPVALREEPAPVFELPAPVMQADVSETITSARQLARDGEVTTALASYEALIRTNSDLETVVDDLRQLVRTHKTNPAVHRVLGDGLVRQGKLQDALDVYREALNQL